MSAAAATTSDAKKDEKEKKKQPRDPAREVIETIVFVVVLVLLLKLFVTEAFVIPTGSMAETLYGYQKIVTCAKCGHQFPVNAHDEVEVNQQTKQKHPMVGYACPNCRFQGLFPRRADTRPDSPDNRTGDRVLVLKPLYHIRPPHRGDVVVFKYPEEPQKDHVAANYIKRAMGFGGETIAIHRGKLYVTKLPKYAVNEDVPAEQLWEKQYMFENDPKALQLFRDSRDAGFTDRVQGGFQIVRKEEDQLLADLRIVWDNDKQPRDLAGVVAPRWQRLGDKSKWKPDNEDQPRAFQHSGDGTDWLRYQHLAWRYGPGNQRVPWQWYERWPESGWGIYMLSASMKFPPVAGPVDNMLGYNAGIDYHPGDQKMQPRDQGRDPAMWVGDLVLECEAEFAGGSEVILELSKGANRFQAKFGNGKVVLERIGPKREEFGKPERACKANTGTHKLRFANVDCRLWVWVDGKRIDFGTEGDYIPVETTTFDPEDVQKEGWVRANDIDAPANVGAKGAVSVKSLKLSRDIYYTRSSGGDQTEADIFYVQPGHYLCLGDNSAQSSDSRRWGVVPERLMLGKAVFVFWPGLPSPNRIGFIK